MDQLADKLCNTIFNKIFYQARYHIIRPMRTKIWDQICVLERLNYPICAQIRDKMGDIN